MDGKTSDGKWPLMEDKHWWNTTFGGMGKWVAKKHLEYLQRNEMKANNKQVFSLPILISSSNNKMESLNKLNMKVIPILIKVQNSYLWGEMWHFEKLLWNIRF